MTSFRQRFAEIGRKLRRAASRSEWAVRLLRLPQTPGPRDLPGLILIQIDGLSQAQLQRALDRRRMPFLRRLLRRKRYRLRTLYSGVPSATPAVQGELFYGVRTAVPSFGYRDLQSGQSVRMFDPGPAAQVQARLAKLGVGLLSGGSAYCDIFSGGAAEPHFCPAEFGWGALWRRVHPIRFVVFMLIYLDSAIRVLGMMAVELVLAVVDCVRGLISRRNLWKELGMVPARVGVGVLLRELLTIGATVDAARGLPVIHVNFLGYDEQSHRRGPASAFAHWSLRGIDRAIHRIWRASRRAHHRSYRVWIYSDHGQEPTVSYAKAMRRSVAQAVAQAFEIPLAPSEPSDPLDQGGAQYERSQWAGQDGLQRMFKGPKVRPIESVAGSSRDPVTVEAMGSLGQVYCPPFASPEDRDRIARRLVDEAGIPLILAADGTGCAVVWNHRGCFRLPQDAAEVFGADHPFLEQVTGDLVAVCHHPDAGQLVVCGWSRGGQSVSFSHESGSHAGPSVDETRAFALLPHNDASLSDRKFLRPEDLRRAAMQLLGTWPDPRNADATSLGNTEP